MNIFNKIVVVIILVFFILVSLLAIVNEFVGLFSWSDDVASRLFNPNTNINPYISTLALLMVITLCVFLLLLQFYRRRLKIAKIYNVDSGKAMITIDTVNQQIREAVLAINGVKGMKNTITSKSSGVVLNMFVEIGKDVNIPEKMDEIINRSVDVCKNKLNINVLDTKLTITNLVSESSEKAKKEVSAKKEEKGASFEKEKVEGTLTEENSGKQDMKTVSGQTVPVSEEDQEVVSQDDDTGKD